MQRKAFAALVDGVKGAGGDALILSGAHVSGEQLDQLSGIASHPAIPATRSGRCRAGPRPLTLDRKGLQC